MDKELISISVEDGTIENIATGEKLFDRIVETKKWIAVVTRDKSKPGTLDREFLDSIDKVHRGLRCRLSKSVKVGCCLEMAAKVTQKPRGMGRGLIKTEQILLIIVSVQTDRLICTEISVDDVPKMSNEKSIQTIEISELEAANRFIGQLEIELKAKKNALDAALAIPGYLEKKLANSKTIANRLRRQFEKIPHETQETLSKFYGDLLLLQEELKVASIPATEQGTEGIEHVIQPHNS